MQFQPSFPAVLASVFSYDLQTADLDADGDSDVMLLAYSSLAPWISRNDGHGDLAPLAAIPVSPLTNPVAALLDFDGDGRLDVFLSWAGVTPNNRALLRNLGNGAWLDATALLPLLPSFTTVVCGDLDGDGDTDIAGFGVSLGLGANVVLENTPTGFVMHTGLLGFGSSVVLADIDGDGDLDVLNSDARIHLWRNDGNFAFVDITASAMSGVPPFSAAAAAGDIDGDGDTDFVLSPWSTTGNPLDLELINTGNNTFVLRSGMIPAVAGGTTSVELVDVDEDGDLDLVRGSNPEPNLGLNDGTGSFSFDTTRWPFANWYSAKARAIDLDQDGDLDFVLAGGGNQPGVLLWNHHRHLEIPSVPTIGGTLTVEVSAAPGYGVGSRLAFVALAAASNAQPLRLNGLGALWLAPASVVAVQSTTIGTGAGPVPVSFPVPADPRLVGAVVHAQALIENTAGALDLRLSAPVSTTIR